MRAIDAERGRATDGRLVEYFEATDGIAAEAELTRLICDALPIAEPIIASRIGRGGRSADDFEDVRSEVLTRLVGRLQRMRALDAEPVSDFQGYVAVVAYNCCHAHFRARFPERARLKLKLRYLMQHDSRFRLQTGAGEVLLCGLAEWPARMFESSGPSAASVKPPAVSGDFRTAPARFVQALLRQFARAIHLDDLADHVAALCGIGTSELLSIDDERSGSSELRDRSATADRTLEGREELQQMWNEISSLPPRQRIALLLNLRDEAGGNTLQAFPLTGVAGLEALATALELTPEELAELWPRLPLDDLTIAERLGLTRQQVINLRKCARERLARRTGRTAVKARVRTTFKPGSDRNA